MKKSTIKKIKIIVSSCLLLLPTFQVAHAQCEVGPVMFRDTLFGAGIGVGVGALVLIANQNSDNIAPNLATATLIGAGVGAVVGIVELSLSDCSASRRNALKKEEGFQARPMFSFIPHNSNIETLSVSSVTSKDAMSFDQLNDIAMGVSLSYTF